MNNLLQPRELLRAVAGGHPVSGAKLARRMGVTRAAVWKQIAALREQGLPIQARAGLGYSLAWPTQLLDADAIAEHLGHEQDSGIQVCWEVDSTQNEMARHLTALPELAVVLAEIQTAGRGRRGREWFSPPGFNLYLSCLKRFDQGFSGLSGLPLAVGVCVVQALEDIGMTGLQLKWPNDVLTEQGKLAGILIDLNGEYQGPCHAIVGVGINMRLPDIASERIGRAAATLADAAETALPDRNLLAARLVSRLRGGLKTFEQRGFAAFTVDFSRLDQLRGRALRIESPAGVLVGVGGGIHADGSLLLQTDNGQIAVTAGDISVHASQRVLDKPRLS